MMSQHIFNLLSGQVFFFFLIVLKWKVLDFGMTIDRDSYQAAVPVA